MFLPEQEREERERKTTNLIDGVGVAAQLASRKKRLKVMVGVTVPVEELVVELVCNHEDYMDGGGYRHEENSYYCGRGQDLWNGTCSVAGCRSGWVDSGKSILGKTFRPSHEHPVYVCCNRWALKSCKHAICSPCWEAIKMGEGRSRRRRG